LHLRVERDRHGSHLGGGPRGRHLLTAKIWQDSELTLLPRPVRSRGPKFGLLAEVGKREKETIPPKMETARKVSKASIWLPNCNCHSPMRKFSIAAVLLFLFAAAAKADVVRILDDPREAMQARADVI